MWWVIGPLSTLADAASSAGASSESGGGLGNFCLGVPLAVLALYYFLPRSKSHRVASRRVPRPRKKMKKSSVSIEDIPPITLTLTETTSRGSTSREVQLLSRKAEDLPEDSARWIPPGESIVVAGRELKGGMIYVGTALRTLRPSFLGSNADPALINPELPVASSPDKARENMGYQPSYSEIPPESRARYLDWLAGGRSDPEAHAGYAILFLYGLERRALSDLLSGKGEPTEWGLISREVERLQALYGDSKTSFRKYAKTFRAALAVLQGAQGEPAFEERALRVGQPSLDVSSAVSRRAREGVALPPGLALLWALGTMDPVALDTRSIDHPRELRELFRLRYTKEYGPGLVVAPLQSPLRTTYAPVSSSFGVEEVVLPTDGLPQPSTVPLRRLCALVKECTQALEPYSEWMWRHKEKGSALAAIALLPPELAMGRPQDDLQPMRQWLEAQLGQAEHGTLRGDELLRQLPGTTPGKLNKSESLLLMQSMEKLGFAVEPDLRFGGAALEAGQSLILFRVGPDAPTAPSASYSAAAVMLHLAAVVSFADGSVSDAEQRRMEAHVEALPKLRPAERTRLRAHLRWLLLSRPGMSGVKKRLEPLSPSMKTALAQLLIDVAGADGQVSAHELKALAKLYPLLGLEPETLYRHVHAASVPPPSPSPSPPPPRPVEVRTAARKSKGVTPPPQPDAAPVGVSLDMSSVRAKLLETAEVSSLLGGIFVEEESPAPAAAPQEPSEGKRVPGLDAAHSALLLALSERASWPRVDFEQLAARLGLLPEGALEALNEAALEQRGETVWEGEDPIEMNTAALKELLA